MTPDNPNGRSQPQTPAQKLGREKRIEDLLQRLRVHPGASVTHHDLGVWPARQVEACVPLSQLRVLDAAYTNANQHFALVVSDRLSCVEDEVEDELLQLPYVSLYRGALLRHVANQSYFLRD